MPHVLVRGLDDEVLKDLKTAARAHGRSLQAEIHVVLRNASADRRQGMTVDVSLTPLAEVPRAFGLDARKALGQHFLLDEAVCRRVREQRVVDLNLD